MAATLIPEEIGLLATGSCTGYANPGLDVHVAKDLGMRPEVRRLAVGIRDVTPPFPGLAVATDYVIAQGRPAVLVCTELPSLHVQPPPHDTQQAVAHALFADACAALVLAPSQIVGEGLDVIAVETLTDVGSTSDMTWDVTDHGFRMSLSPRVPALVARNVATLVDRLLTDRGVAPDDVLYLAIHPGGPRIIDKVQDVFSLSDVQIKRSRDILSRYGNCSSATILLTLASICPVPVGDYVLAMAFGPGLTVTGALLQGAAKKKKRLSRPMHNQADDIDRRDAYGGGERHSAAAAHGDDREYRAEPEGRPHPRGGSSHWAERRHRRGDR